MAPLWIIAIFLLTAVQMGRTEYDPEICTVFRNSYGLIPPPLPTNLELKASHVDNLNNYTTYHEMYMDYANSRGKYMYLLNGIEHHMLFDYQTQQVVEWDVFHPGVDIKDDPLSHGCTASSIEDSEYREVFGYLDDYTNSPKMYNSNQALLFGGQYQYAANGTNRMSERGLLVDKFIGCLYQPSMKATIAANYSFTNSIALPSGGTLLKDVIGIEDGLLSVPVQADFFGAIFNDQVAKNLVFNMTQNIFWFKGEPDFALETFRIPPYMYCEGYNGRSEMLPFPIAFSTRLQKTAIKRDELGKLATKKVTSYEEIYYYKEKNLARRDFIPDTNLDTDIHSRFLNYAPVKTIYDFNTGVMYVTNQPTGRCYTRSIISGDFFDTSRDSLFIQIGTPEEIFRMQTDDMEFKGTDFSRDIECDVWTGEYHDEHYNKTYVKETYISTNGWHSEVKEVLAYGVPVKHTIISNRLSDDLAEDIKTTHFLKFKPTPPRLQHFDVSNCIETIDHWDLALFLTVSEDIKKTLFNYKMQFEETAQYYLTEITQIFTPLRVQRLELRQLSLTDLRVQLMFTLVDKANLKTQTPVGQPGASLEDAAVNLQTIVDTNQFAMTFHPPKPDGPVTVLALKGSLYIRTADGDLESPTRFLLSKKLERDPFLNNNVTPPTILYDDSEDEKKKGMSSGNLALLAIAMLFIGIGIGISVMYLYFRRASDNKLEDRITLTPQASTSKDVETAADESEIQ